MPAGAMIRSRFFALSPLLHHSDFQKANLDHALPAHVIIATANLATLMEARSSKIGDD
jgi:hypothetical protein